MIRAALIALVLSAGAAFAAPVDIPVPARFPDAMAIISPDARPSREYTLENRQDGYHLTDWALAGSPPSSDAITSALALFDWHSHQDDARTAIEVTDLVALRCFKAGVAYPDEWRTYYLALRAILSAPSGDASQPLPTQPAFPPGT